MKLLTMFILLTLSFRSFAAVPTEEGLLKNLNNGNIPTKMLTIKAMVQSTSVTTSPGEVEVPKSDYYKFVLNLDNPNTVSLFQIAYSNAQMLSSQIKDVTFIPDLLGAIRKEKSPERGMFYAVFMMLTTNRSIGMEAFLEKGGVQIVKNKNLLNDEKIKLFRAYRAYLASNKGKGEANSPLNPADPQNKAKIIELFRANTFERSKNIELVKVENEFFWKADWKSTQAYFSNEERRLRKVELKLADAEIKLEASDYMLFNNTNELPKFIRIKDSSGQSYKMQIMSLDSKNNNEKKLTERYEEEKKQAPQKNVNYFSFLF